MKKFAMIALAVLAVVLLSLSVFVVITNDKTGPQISFTKDIVYAEGADTSVLLDGVTAIDDKDGDVSDTLIIERVAVLNDKNKATVHYAAKDKSNNLTKTKRDVDYIAAADGTVNTDPLTDQTPDEQTADKKYDIMLINNLGVENLATEWSYKLESDGHTVTALGLSTDAVQAQTVIYVEKEGDGTELLKYFPTAKIQVGSAADRIIGSSAGANVFVVFGTNDSNHPA